MQPIDVKQAEIEFRRGHYWNAADSVDHFRRSLDDRRAFFAAAIQAGRIKPPLLEIGAEYGVNGMLLEDEMGLPTVGLDLSLRALQAADVVARYFGKQPNEQRVAGDGERLPFAAGSFGTVLLWGTLHHFNNVTRLLSEIRRVLVADGRLIIAEEPIRRAWRVPLFRTAGGDRLGGISRLLLRVGILPYLARIGGRAETSHGIVEREFRIAELDRFFASYASPEWFYEPRLTGGVPAAGPLTRFWWWLGEPSPAAKKRAVRHFGGVAFGWMNKPAVLRDLGGGRYLVQKHPEHDRLTIRGFQGAMMCNGEPLTSQSDTIELPAATRGRTHLVLDIPRFFTRLDLWSADGRVGLVSRFTDETPPAKPETRLACPDCLVFTDHCIYGSCNKECMMVVPMDFLDPTDSQQPFRRLDYDYEDCLYACPHGGLDRPVLKDNRCPECRRLFSRDADVLDCRPKRLDDYVNLRELENSARF